MSAPLAHLAMLQGGALFWSGAATARTHTLRALKLTIPLDGALLLRLPGEPLALRLHQPVLVAPLAAQELGCEGASLSMFLDPDALPVRRLIGAMRGPVQVLEGAQAEALWSLGGALRDPCASREDARCWVDEASAVLTPRGALAPPWDGRVSAAMAQLRAAHGAQLPLAQVAAAVGLSPTRLAHVWKAYVGMPIRAWVLWQRLIATMERTIAGESLAQAAHSAGFADQPHLNRTAMQMIGRRPGEVMGRGKILQDWAPPGA
jgi:AraC family transcriptional regulator